MKAAPQRIAILGAASSGKSTLAAGLARRYNTPWVPEYLREFVDTRGRIPVEADQFHIAATQRAREDVLAAGDAVGKYLFCDTAPLMTAVYGRHYFGVVDAQLAQLAASHARDYSVTLVAAFDVPWAADGLHRECEEVSHIVNRLLLEELGNRAIPYVLVQGSPEQRLSQVEQLLGLVA